MCHVNTLFKATLSHNITYTSREQYTHRGWLVRISKSQHPNDTKSN